jgi:hypothetical protein
MGEPDSPPGPLSQAVAFATIGRAAVERHAETEAILAYEDALPLAEAALAEAALAGGDGPDIAESLRRQAGTIHRYLRSGHDPAEALSRAKQDVRSSHPHVYRHPYTWAGFIVLGPA